jgi:hypothetical protein
LPLPLGLSCGEKGPDPSDSFSGLNCQTYIERLWHKEMILAHRIKEISGKQNNQSSYFFQRI